MSKLLQNTYVDIEKVTDIHEKDINMVDENADDVELNVDADVDVHYQCNNYGKGFQAEKLHYFTQAFCYLFILGQNQAVICSTFGRNQEISYFFQGH